MRLIDADELKKAFEETVCIEPIPYAFVKQIIDNAPTVECERNIMTEEAYLRLQASKERPHGEWIFKHSSSDIWCSVCDENFDEIPQKFKFCPNCGADMRGNNNGKK